MHPADTNVKWDIYNKHSVILVVFKSEKSNTFLNVNESNFEVLVESKKVFDLELIIKPADLFTAKLLSVNLEEYFPSNNIQINGRKSLQYICQDRKKNKI